MVGIIYLATNQVNGKVYVGQTYQKLNDRINHHYRAADRAAKIKTRDFHFYRALRKYNKNDWLWDELENFEMEERITLKKVLNKYEIYYIKVCDSTDQDYGYNSTFGGSSNVPNDYVKLKMSLAHIGIPCSNNAKIKIGNALRGKSNWWKDRPKSSEHKEHIRQSKAGIPCRPEIKEKIRITCESNPTNYWSNKHRDEITKKKLSIAKLGTTDNPETKAKKSKSATLAWARRKGVING